jgi:hypothetical protein
VSADVPDGEGAVVKRKRHRLSGSWCQADLLKPFELQRRFAR